MKILSIVVYGSSKYSYAASLDTNFLSIGMNPAEKNIKNWLEEDDGINATYLRSNPGIYTAGIPGAAAYAYSTGQKIIIMSMDQEIKSSQAQELLLKAETAQNSKDLMLIIKNPEAFAVSKIEKINANLNEAKENVFRIIDKLIDRQEKIENLLIKTDDLQKQSELFRMASTHLKNEMHCSMWSLFAPIARIVASPVTVPMNAVASLVGLASPKVHFEYQPEPEYRKCQPN